MQAFLWMTTIYRGIFALLTLPPDGVSPRVNTISSRDSSEGGGGVGGGPVRPLFCGGFSLIRGGIHYRR